jgi:hypothetical protein
MDYSDYLRRKIGKAVYADLIKEAIPIADSCISNVGSIVCYTRPKPKSFEEANQVAAGSSAGGCSYGSINENGSFTYVPKCPPTEYINTVGITGAIVNNTSEGLYIGYSNDGTPLYSFKIDGYLGGTPVDIQQGSLYTISRYTTNMRQTGSNWSTDGIQQPTNIVNQGFSITSWSDSIIPITVLDFGGNSGAYNYTNVGYNYFKKLASGKYYIGVEIGSDRLNIYKDGSLSIAYNNSIQPSYSATIIKLQSNYDPLWRINFDNYYTDVVEANANIKMDTDNNENLFVSYNRFSNNGEIPEADGNYVALPGIVAGLPTDAGYFLINYDSNGNAIWASTIYQNRVGASGNETIVKSTPSGNLYIMSPYEYPDTPIFYNSNGTTSNIPPLPNTNTSYGQYITSYTNTGIFNWSSGMVGTAIDQYDACVSADSNVYVCGKYIGSNVFYDSNGTTNTISNVNTPYKAGYIAKYNSSGTAQWSLSFTVNYFDSTLGTSYENGVKSISIDSSSNIYAIMRTGTCNARIYKNNTLVNSLSVSNLDYGAVDAVVKINPSGDIQWISAIGIPNYVTGNDSTSFLINKINSGNYNDTIVVGGLIGGDTDLICRNSSGTIKLSNTTRL